jgi:hypothetical protein
LNCPFHGLFSSLFCWSCVDDWRRCRVHVYISSDFSLHCPRQ